MREIKFRAWDVKRTEIIYFDLDLCNEESRAWWNEQIKGNPVMQYTGLNDRNGKEIYDGDIVVARIYRDENEVGYVQACRVDWDKENAMFTLYGWYGQSLKHFNKIKVIGNVYENPELLTK